MTIEQKIEQDGIEEVVHFTTSHGCLGTLFTDFLKSRAKLENDPMVEFLFAPNAALRKDVDYLDHVSLSINHINTKFYKTSAGSWHRAEPIFWCILSFDPVILTHDGVEFATTNNMYSGVRRATGRAGFDALYADVITQWRGMTVRRPDKLPRCWPTCFQAEALYPGAVSTEFLRKIYVRNGTDQSEVVGFLRATLHRDVAVVIAPEKFEDRPA